MKLVAYVIDGAGAAWDGLAAEVVAPGAPLVTLGKGLVTAGKLEVLIKSTGVFGLRIEGTGVLTAPVRVEGDLVDLGTVVWAKEPLVAMELFWADGGKVHGLPKALAAALAARAEAPAEPAPDTPPTEPPPEPAPEAPLDTSLGAVLSRTGEDLAAAQRSLAETGGFLLGTVQLTLRASDGTGGLKVGGLSGGTSEVQVTLVPAPETRVVSRSVSTTTLAAANTTTFATLTPDKATDYPTMPEGGGKLPTVDAAPADDKGDATTDGTTTDGTTTGGTTGGTTTTGGLTITPTLTDGGTTTTTGGTTTTTGGTTTTSTTGGTTTTTTGTTNTGTSDTPRVPDVLGYSRALAERKLAALGLVADVSRIVTAGPAGVVARQSPAPGTATAPGAAVRLYVNLGRS